MPLYFVEMFPSLGQARDDPYDDLERALDDARAGAKQLVAEALRDGASLKEALNRMFQITNERGDIVMLVSFEDAVETDAKP